MKHNIVITILSILLVLTMVVGGYFAFNTKDTTPIKTSTEPREIEVNNAQKTADELYKYLGTKTTTPSKIKSLIHSMEFIGFEIENIAIEKGFVTINYKVDSRTKYRFMDDYIKNFNQTCATLFVLADDINNVSITVSDNYGQFFSYSKNKKSKEYANENNVLNTQRFETAKDSKENFREFVNDILLIQDTSNNNHYLKQIYNVLSSNLQVNENSKIYVKKPLDNKTLFYLSQIGIELNKYKNSVAEIFLYNVEDYTQNELKNYIFVFIDKNLVVNEIISSPMQYEELINNLNN